MEYQHLIYLNSLQENEYQPKIDVDAINDSTIDSLPCRRASLRFCPPFVTQDKVIKYLPVTLDIHVVNEVGTHLPCQTVINDALATLKEKESTTGVPWCALIGGIHCNTTYFSNCLKVLKLKDEQNKVLKEDAWIIKLYNHIEQPYGTQPIDLVLPAGLISMIQDKPDLFTGNMQKCV